MVLNLNSIMAKFTLRRVIAGLVFPPLLACAFQPFADLYLSYAERLVFWAGVMVFALCVTSAAGTLTQKYFADTRFSWGDAAFVLIILALFVPSVWFMSWLVFTAGGQQAPGVLSVAPYGALFAAGLFLTKGHSDTSPEPDKPVPNSPRLAKRLPDTFKGQIYRLTVRDHFVDVVTSEGTFTIRSRFTDAIADMEPVCGYCTHRSHWVTAQAITGFEREDSKVFVRLKNRDLVPVSRKYKPLLEQNGVV